MSASAAMNRPKGNTMEGMIFNANDILQKAVAEESNGIPPNIVQNCHGVVVLSTFQVGAVLSGSGGSGILLKHDPISKEWSMPVACEVSSAGLGLTLGATHMDLIVFCLDTPTLEAITKSGGSSFGMQATEALGRKFGRHENVDINPTNFGTVIFSYSEGAFVGVSVEGALVRPNGKANFFFYGEQASAADILAGKHAMPEGKVTLMDQVLEKLNILAKGETSAPDETEKSIIIEAKKVADVAEEEKGDEGEVKESTA